MWPVKATILTGPRRSGRTLLARSFVERVGGRLFDDAEGRDEEELFHAWNQAQDSGRPLVMIADEVPPAWMPKLPDLKTRLAVTPVTRIGHPDDSLFAALHRDYWTAERAVEAVDRHALSERARLSLPTIRRALLDARMISEAA
jgi:chromosomal replication initiation ATPase DnaA